jgi:GNAT superfamily N-acetyltransferase
MAVIEIVEVARLSSDEYRRLHGWDHDVFGTAHLHLEFRHKDLHFLLYEDDRLVSHVGVLTHTVSIDGRDARVGGLGGVVTLPGSQRRGHARRLMERAARWFAAQPGLEAALLFCLPHMVAYYERLSWRRVEAPVDIEQPGRLVRAPLPMMLLPLGGPTAVAAGIDLRSLPW